VSAVDVRTTGEGEGARVVITLPAGRTYPSPTGISADLTVAEARDLRNHLVAVVDALLGTRWFR
jgi:hypothetical protein